MTRIRMRKPPKSVCRLSVIAAALAASCSNPEAVTGQGRELLRGAIEFFGDPVEITAPDAVTAGAPFAVTVTTYGNGCVALGETRVTVSGLTVVVEPFDWVAQQPPGAACPEQLILFSHLATVEIVERGTATLRVRGRREPGGELLEVERSIVVR